MKMLDASIPFLAAVTLCQTASAANPHMGGPMKHVMVTRVGDALHITVDESVERPVLQNYGETYDGPAGVLDGAMYNSQYGWVVEGFWTIPPGSSLWIEQVWATPGMRAYTGSDIPAPFAPIFGTSASAAQIQWDGTMLHNWYAVEAIGVYEATYRVYIGDAMGDPIPGYDAGIITLDWTTQGCGADFDESGFIDTDDFDAFIAAFEAGGDDADFDGSGFVDLEDFTAYVHAFEAGC